MNIFADFVNHMLMNRANIAKFAIGIFDYHKINKIYVYFKIFLLFFNNLLLKLLNDKYNISSHK
jgi:hypothetical protein